MWCLILQEVFEIMLQKKTCALQIIVFIMKYYFVFFYFIFQNIFIGAALAIIGNLLISISMNIQVNGIIHLYLGLSLSSGLINNLLSSQVNLTP